MNLSVELTPNAKRNLTLANPVMTASGTFGYGTEFARLMDIQRLGAIVCKGTTLRPRKGNAQPRIVETPAGMLNSIGLQNIGVRALIREKAPQWAGWRVPVLVNIAGESLDEFAILAGLLDNVPGVSGLEVNISCPNVASGGMIFGCDPLMAGEVTRAVKSQTSLPVIVKLTPNVTDIVAIAEVVAEAGADAISLTNTLLGMSIDTRKRAPVLGNVMGGLSGPAIKPVALRMVYQVFRSVGIPLIGLGGIASANDALEFIMAGASAIQVGTMSFVNPATSLDVLAGIEKFMQDEGVADINELIGIAHNPGVLAARKSKALVGNN